MTPDLWCFGKVIGGGLPVGAFGGRRALLAELAPDGPVYQAGTLSGNPLATAAGLAVLETVGPADYEALAARVALFAKDLEAAIAAGGLAVSVPVVGPLVGLFLAPAGAGPIAPPSDYEVRAPWPATASTAGSSTPCCGAAWRSPPAPTRSCSRASPTTRPCWPGSSRPPARRRRKWPGRRRARSEPTAASRRSASAKAPVTAG